MPPTAGWRRKVVIAPALAVFGVLLVVCAAVLDDRHGKRASALCHHLPVPWTLFVLAWASLLCGLAASVLCALFFRAARRDGRRGTESWQGTLAVCICVAGALPLLFEAMAVYGVHAEAGEAYWSCAGAAGLLG
jgi:drug/metabolite transporter (DMT)-like permease